MKTTVKSEYPSIDKDIKMLTPDELVNKDSTGKFGKQFFSQNSQKTLENTLLKTDPEEMNLIIIRCENSSDIVRSFIGKHL